jgi:hypothetical protein
MGTVINSPMELVTPAYNTHTHIISLEDDTLDNDKLNEGRLFFRLFNTNIGFFNFNFFYYNQLSSDNLLNISVTNTLVTDNMLYEWSLQPNRQNELLVLQNFFDADTMESSSTVNSKFMLQNILACYNQWAYIFNSTFLNNYFYFDVYFDKDLYDSQPTILFEDWKNICYVRYVPLKGKFYTLTIESSGIMDNLTYTETLTPNSSLLLQQPNHKIEVHLGNQKFPLNTKVYNKVFEYQTPIAKDVNGNYNSYININRIMQRYLHTLTPIVGNVRPQTDYMKPYWFSATERGNLIKNNRYISSITQAEVVNYDRTLINLELDNAESSVKWVCNAAKDKLSLYTMKDYYVNDTTIVPLALTNQPILKDSYYCNDNFNNSREFVSFIFNGDTIETISVLTKVVFNDGTTTNLTKTIKVSNPTYANTYTVDISPDVIGLRELDNQDIYSWEVRLSAIVEDIVIPGDFQDGLRLDSNKYLQGAITEIVPAAVESVYSFSSIVYLNGSRTGGIVYQNYYNVSFDPTSGILIRVEKVGADLVITFKAVIYQFYNEISKVFTLTGFDFNKFICFSCVKTASRAATDLKCYVNGVELIGTVLADNIPSSISAIARRANAWVGIPSLSDYFNGDLLDMQLHFTALTEGQHTSYYNSRTATNPSTGVTPSLHWNFNEKEGGQALCSTPFYSWGLYNYSASEIELGNPSSKWIRVGTPDTIIEGGSFDLVKPVSYKRLVNGMGNRYNILFINQLGMWDTFTFTGDIDFNYSQKYNKYRTTQAISYTPNDLITGNYNSMVVKGFTLRSSQLDTKHKEWLQELLDSPEIKIFNNNKLESYYITKSDFKMDSVKNLYTLNLDVVRTIENNSINN